MCSYGVYYDICQYPKDKILLHLWEMGYHFYFTENYT